MFVRHPSLQNSKLHEVRHFTSLAGVNKGEGEGEGNGEEDSNGGEEPYCTISAPYNKKHMHYVRQASSIPQYLLYNKQLNFGTR